MITQLLFKQFIIELLVIYLFWINIRLHEDDQEEASTMHKANVMDQWRCQTHWFYHHWSVSLMTYNVQRYDGYKSWGEVSLSLFLIRRSAKKKRNLFIEWASMVNIFDASGSIINIASHWNTQRVIRTTIRNIDVVMIGLHQWILMHWGIAQSE